MLGVVVLCAGESRRMRSDLPKIFHLLGGRQVVEYVGEVASDLAGEHVIFVVSDNLKTHPFFESKCVAIQDKPLGTADAALVGVKKLDPKVTDVLILCGDTPLIQTCHLLDLLTSHSDLSVIATKPPSPDSSYGRVVIEAGFVKKIVEFKDASEIERNTAFVSSGVFKVKREILEKILPKVKKSSVSGEYYLPQIVEIAASEGIKTKAVEGPFEVFLGINDKSDLALAEATLQNKWRRKFLDDGVTLKDPNTVYFSHNTKIGKDCVVEPFVSFGVGVELQDRVHVKSFSNLSECVVHSDCQIGPFAHIRKNTTLHSRVNIGNFVEVKGSTLETKVKAKHLSYIGDTKIGEGSNIGAGAVTCNFNGYEKSQTDIGKGVFVGSNATLIAPVVIEDGAYVAAGTVVNNQVPKDSLAIGRARTEVKPMWAKEFSLKSQKN